MKNTLISAHKEPATTCLTIMDGIKSENRHTIQETRDQIEILNLTKTNVLSARLMK